MSSAVAGFNIETWTSPGGPDDCIMWYHVWISFQPPPGGGPPEIDFIEIIDAEMTYNATLSRHEISYVTWDGNGSNPQGLPLLPDPLPFPDTEALGAYQVQCPN